MSIKKLKALKAAKSSRVDLDASKPDTSSLSMRASTFERVKALLSCPQAPFGALNYKLDLLDGYRSNYGSDSGDTVSYYAGFSVTYYVSYNGSEARALSFLMNTSLHIDRNSESSFESNIWTDGLEVFVLPVLGEDVKRSSLIADIGDIGCLLHEVSWHNRLMSIKQRLPVKVRPHIDIMRSLQIEDADKVARICAQIFSHKGRASRQFASSDSDELIASEALSLFEEVNARPDPALLDDIFDL